MSIPEDMIMKHLNLLLTSSDPGDSMSHLHVVAAPYDAVGPLGTVDEKLLRTSIYAIDAAGKDPDEFTVTVIAHAAVEHLEKGESIRFAVLSQEMWALTGKPDKLAEQLHREHRLSEHPDADEVTAVYGACRDGRRWYGQRWLTGPKAGPPENLEIHVGPIRRGEAPGMRNASLLLRMVGLA